MSRLKLPKGTDITSYIDLNKLYIQQGGYNWSKLLEYKDFVVYKDVEAKYYQVRNKKGTYLFNCKSLDDGIKAIEEIYYQ